MQWPSTFKQSDRFDPKSFHIAWTSENFDIIINFCINYRMEKERMATLLMTNGECARVDCREPFWYMLYAMYLQQSRDEQEIGAALNTDHKGFNRFDAKFLTDIAQCGYSSGLLSPAQLHYAAKTLKKYKRQVLALGTPVKTHPEQLEIPLAIDKTYSV